MMENDELLAKELQKQFDKEDKLFRQQVLKDATAAPRITSIAHPVSETEDSLPPCKYGADCYRKNALHAKEFWHPMKRKSEAVCNTEPLAKKCKKQTFLVDEKDESSKDKVTAPSCSGNNNRPSINMIAKKTGFPGRFEQSFPHNIFLNKIYCLSETHKDNGSLVLPDLLHASNGKLIESAQMNFMVDLNFVQKSYAACDRGSEPLLVMYGQLAGNPRDFSNITCCQVQMPYQFGVHHSKVMMFKYEHGLRVVIHTANMIEDDWVDKTQGYWVSPIFPLLKNGRSSLLDGESETCFKRDFVEYLVSYKSPDLNRWGHIVRAHDLSSCRVFFVGSAPGYHVGETRYKYGHLKVRQLLRKHSTWKPNVGLPVIAQCSSIGSLGKDANSWLTGELGRSLSGGSDTSSSTVKVIYPSEDDVRNCCQGYGGGSCLPYNSKTHGKQLWFTDHLHVWRSEKRNRTRAMPHIKAYTRVRADTELQYLLLSSANLSKAAWGQLQKQNSQVFIRSYEAGVLLLPKFIESCDAFKVSDSNVPLHFDLPLTRYPQGARPWLMDVPKNGPDVLGNTM